MTRAVSVAVKASTGLCGVIWKDKMVRHMSQMFVCVVGGASTTVFQTSDPQHEVVEMQPFAPNV